MLILKCKGAKVDPCGSPNFQITPKIIFINFFSLLSSGKKILYHFEKLVVKTVGRKVSCSKVMQDAIKGF